MRILPISKRSTASATGSAKPDALLLPGAWWLWRAEGGSVKRQFSPIVARILAVNVMALAILVGSLLYLGRYQDRIIATELDSLLLQSRIIASAVTENAVVVNENDAEILSPLLARLMVRRLAETTETRTRLFGVDGAQLADSRVMLGGKARGKLDIPPPQPPGERPDFVARFVSSIFNLIDALHERHEYPLFTEQDIQHGDQYTAVRAATGGAPATQVWRTMNGHLMLAAAVPVLHMKRVLGVVMMSRSDSNVDRAITSVRIDILNIFCATLCVTILLSLYLARAIARPIRLLAIAAEGLRHGQMKMSGLAGTASLLRREAIPDMTERGDEIGDLSGALRDLTAALAERVRAIENFAADVAHEIKNPLTSLRSAVETAERVQDPAARQRLMDVIRDDVDRLDRLISDISNASRLDAELSRDRAVAIDLATMLSTLVDHYRNEGDGKQPDVALAPIRDRLVVMGVETRFAQVLRNLIDNALSFSPPGARVMVAAQREGRFVRITVDDSGPGIPPGKLESVFDRFYTERPKTEKFGTHSGLGLSIAKQIVEAHRGKIWAENRIGAGGATVGARFVVVFPLVED